MEGQKEVNRLFILFLIVVVTVTLPGIFSNNEVVDKILYIYNEDPKIKTTAKTKEKDMVEDLDSTGPNSNKESEEENDYDHSKKAEELLDKIKHG